MRNLRPILHPAHGLPPRNRNISVPAPVIPALSPGRKGKIPGRFTQQRRKERALRSPDRQHPHRIIPPRPGRVQKTPILLLPAPEAAVILPLQNPTVHLPADPAAHPGQVVIAVAAEAAAAEAAVAEAIAAEAIAAVAHVVEEGKPNISQS